jgi:hypothetical protein
MNNDLIEQAKQQIGKGEQLQQAKKQSAGFINQIFYNLKLIFPAWRQNFKTEREILATKELWLNTLIDENITTQEQIDRALKGAKLADSAFFPSIGQFIKWSKKDAPRVNEQAYQIHTPKLRPHTTQEYADMAEGRAAEIKKRIGL